MRAAIAAVAFLVGCAAYQPGHDLYKAGDIHGAKRSWENCASHGDHMCMALMGTLYEDRRIQSNDPQGDAVRWYTLAARHGNGWARTRLTTLGEPVPPADLAEQPQQVDPGGAIGEALGQALRRAIR